jgi:hypothetical protein
MFAPKDEGIISFFKFLNIFWIFPIAFGGKDALKGVITIK